MGEELSPDHGQPVVEVEIKHLRPADSPRLEGEDGDHVDVLATAATPLPPIIVHRETMRVIDGMHRLRAAESRGDRTVRATFFDGDEADAFVLAVQANLAGGLPLSLGDRKRAAARIIASHPQWSDRRIASTTGLAAGTIADVRRTLPSRTSEEDRRVGRDGRMRPLNSSRGRLIAYQLIARTPSLSLRQIARIAGISPETARDVRNRFHRDEGPLPQTQRPSRVPAPSSPAPPPPVLLDGPLVSPEPVPGDRRNALTEGHQRWSGARSGGTGRPVSVERLRADPTLRFSQSGRVLLRLLAVKTISPPEWQELIEKVPPHLSPVVAELSRECAEAWARFADRLEHSAGGMASTG